MTIEEIYTKHYQEVFNHVMSAIKDIHDSEEVTNNIFLKMFRLKCAQYDKKHGAALRTWIRTITNHQILDYFRTNHQNYYQAVSDFNDDQKDGRSFLQFIAPDNVNADSIVLTDELQDKIAKAFRALKPKYRKIATLYFLREKEYSEIAELMDVPMGTVKGMISRARAKLQEELEGTRNYNVRNVQTTNI
jgi:RNA polymerase sigma-70 factor, ECF subfamily